MTMYIKTPEGGWTVLGGLMEHGIVMGEAPVDLGLYSPRLETNFSVGMEFEFKMAEFGRVDTMMLFFGLSRKKVRKMSGVKPLLKKGKAWR